ncbi:glycine betaine ABC transporter substrate-binding protein [Actinophytocola xanthii]|uniref:Glycine/betaine ABC transporter substrate-binding protein n=1 Tax=Actinophytocola xanthii TaxID=1912961 RepID=A0A1Q8BWC5_9PSEU|nr:glycine betaine ABC transporter substrate-binding protein [Actinophytocola xanthii]OLF06408.1 glycine/betaine ABC transporter substrate-binding protein [Actinophytocola xanthii]
MGCARRPWSAVLALATAAALAGGCTIEEDNGATEVGEGSISRIDELSGVQLTVGSKEFDEQLLLGQVAIVALRAAGADPVDRTNITGSANVRQALTSGEIDLYWEYTGTGWINYLKNTRPVPDAEELYDAVKEADLANGVVWWARSPANDTYAIAVNQEALAEYGTRTLSDYAELARTNPAAATTCIGPEFKSRDDGFPGLQKAYGFTLPDAQIHLLNDAVIYPTAGRGGTCNFGEVATTDGRVSAQNLTPLEDDKHFFPVYNPAITIRAELAEEYPDLERVFEPIAEKLDTDILTELNKKVSVDGDDPAEVATDWLRSEGFVS